MLGIEKNREVRTNPCSKKAQILILKRLFFLLRGSCFSFMLTYLSENVTLLPLENGNWQGEGKGPTCAFAILEGG